MSIRNYSNLFSVCVSIERKFGFKKFQNFCNNIKKFKESTLHVYDIYIYIYIYIYKSIL